MQKRTALLSLFAVVLSGSLVWLYASSPANPADGAGKELKARLFEMRTYTTAPGRIDALNKRFREHTNYLFVKHGMTLVGYWEPTDKPNTLVYILAYADKESRDKSWKGFMSDPAWQKAWADSKKDGPVVTKVEASFLKPTDYSPIR